MRNIVIALALPLVLITACVDTPDSHQGSDAKTAKAPAPKQDHPAAVAKVVPPALDATAAVNFPGLHNVVTYHEGLICGSAPDGEEGFETLKGMGIRTIISVDGTVPDVASAKADGIRYVHLPITYAGMDEDRTLEIARAVEELPGPIYIHCHHGKPRSAAAAGAACVTLGYMTSDEAKSKLTISGTAAVYKGLWQCVAVATRATPADLAAAKHAFPEVSKPKGLVPSMVAIDEETDGLKAAEKAGWKAPKDNPDLVPVAVAGRLADHFRELEGDSQFAARPTDFHDWLKANQKNAQAIEDELGKPAPDAKTLSAELKTLNDTCNACHVKYRN